MRYTTRATLVARLRSNDRTTLFIPSGEAIEAESDPANPLRIRLIWRGQDLEADDLDFARSTEPAETVLER